MTAKTYLQRHPHARGTSIAQKALEESMTARLRAEIAMNSRPKSETTIRAMMRGIAKLMQKIGGEP